MKKTKKTAKTSKKLATLLLACCLCVAPTVPTAQASTTTAYAFFSSLFKLQSNNIELIEISMAQQPNVTWVLEDDTLDELLTAFPVVTVVPASAPTALTQNCYTIHGTTPSSGFRFTIDETGFITLLSVNQQNTHSYYRLQNFDTFKSQLDVFLTTQSPGYQVLTPSLTQDVQVSEWAAPFFESATAFDLLPPQLEKGFMTDEITRELFCDLLIKFLERSIDFSLDPYTINIYNDTKNLHLITLQNRGLIYGKTTNLFAPNDFITRQEAAVILANMATQLNIPRNPGEISYEFEDFNEISYWAVESIDYLINLKVMLGGSTGFDPHGHFSKEEALVTVMNLYRCYSQHY